MTGTIFAKFAFTAAVALAGGSDFDLPAMTPASVPSPAVALELDAFQHNRPARAPRQFLCTAPGVYTITVRLAVTAVQVPIAGKVWLQGPVGAELLAAFTAAPGAPGYVAASLPVSSAGDCYRIAVDASGAVTLGADPREAFVVFSR